MKLELLKSFIGKEFQMYDEEDNYIGCLEPMYICYPKLPRYPFPKDISKRFTYPIEKLEEVGTKIATKDIKKGDIITFKLLKGSFHMGVYLGKHKMIQTFIKSSIQISKIDLNNPRIAGIYRIKNKY